MLSSIFDSRPRRRRDRGDQSPFASTYARTATPPRDARRFYNRRRALRYADEQESGDGSSEENDEVHHAQGDENEGADEENDDDDDGEEGGGGEEEEEATPLLPIFDSSLLDTLPIYTLTHTIRLVVSSKCETVLTWEQLRSPQVSQFLIKPIQQEIRAKHFSAATIYCLLANCLQFTKEIAIFPGNSGTIQTRALVCELVAIRLLREYTTRRLIDALSYDFDPLQGQLDVGPQLANNHRPRWQPPGRWQQPRSARISTLEIAIRAQAKRFLSHPLVVQQLEAIWDGAIVFHAAADNVHRGKLSKLPVNYGALGVTDAQTPPGERKFSTQSGSRKVVTLYNPRDASLFKLSRLRVPRYRNILSTISFAILLGLFVAVLDQRSAHITGLEVFFWVWAGGYMMDEIVGVTEQGFGLYIASFWNTFDLGILLILFVHLCLRIYGILMPDVRKRRIADTAFDLLAADAILLFPRLFSVLDHYRYFSQLIIAFRLMTADLVAVFVLIVISCSGFFVALTFSFGSDGRDDAYQVAYALLQMVMGFTPAVWDRWDSYTILGRTILVLFLFLCHFLIITILITVLTNSFMAVVKNANEEHQFLFAINTISSVKSDSLFSYIPPLNVLQWSLTPLRYTLPFRQYVKLNRTVIKVTHFPILFTIYLYEKMILQAAVVDSIDLVENRPHARSMLSRRLPRLAREVSVGNFRQDQALEQVFKQPFDATLRTQVPNNRRNSNTVVKQWMHDMSEDDAGSPQEDDPSTVAKLEKRRLGERSLSAFSRVRRSSQRAPSVASDPGDVTALTDFFSPRANIKSTASIIPSDLELDMQEDTGDGDGDDEMLTNDNDDDRMTADSQDNDPVRLQQPPDHFTRRSIPTITTPQKVASVSSNDRGRRSSLKSGQGSPSRIIAQAKPEQLIRNFSSATMILHPVAVDIDSSKDGERFRLPAALSFTSLTPGSKQTSSGGGKKALRPKQATKTRPLFPTKDNPAFRSTPDTKAVLHSMPNRNTRPTSLAMDLVSDIGDNKAIGGGYVGAIPASFATELAYATKDLQKRKQERTEEQEMFGRVMMARMNTLEEGFREVVHEMRENRRSNPGSKPRSPERPALARRERRKEEKGKTKETHVVNVRDGDSGSGSLQNLKQSESPATPASLTSEIAQTSSEIRSQLHEKRVQDDFSDTHGLGTNTDNK